MVQPVTRRRRSLPFGRRALGSPRQQAVHTVLGDLGATTRPLRAGIDARSAYRVAKATRQLLDVAAVGLGDRDDLLAFVGTGARAHAETVWSMALTLAAPGNGRVQTGVIDCDDPTCPLGEAVVAPIRIETGPAGVLVVVTAKAAPATLALVRSVGELARQMATQLELGANERRRQELREARLAALRSQMSPHFVYNTITAIASLTRTDPERARELLFRFAELSRYVLRNDRVTMTLAEELRIVHVYMELERARKGDRIEIVFRIDPGALPVPIPMLVLQPLVENAVQHGLADVTGRGVVTVEAHDRGYELAITVRDNGAGMRPEVLRSLTAGQREGSVALGNVRSRLEAAFGAEATFEIESAPGEGTAVHLRMPRTGLAVSA
jgi:two-component system LytT family sensor kinase